MHDLPGVQMFWIAILFDVVRIAFFDILAIRARLRSPRSNADAVRRKQRTHSPLITVIIPAYNEQQTLEMTLSHVLASHYRKLEVIIIDDGSSDDTAVVARRLAARHRNVTTATQRRGGKSAALNLGLAMARGEFIFQVDSDTQLHPDAISHLLATFDDPRVHAAAGRIKVSAPERNVVTRLQAIEFIMSFGAGRIASDELGITKVISGSFAMWRTSVLREVGSWDHPMGEDGDLTLKVRKKQGVLRYCHEAVCENHSRDNWRGLTNQRFRWNRNYIKNRVRKHLDIANPATFGWSNFWMFIDSIVYRLVLFTMIMLGLINMLLREPSAVLPRILTLAVLYSVLTLIQFPLDVWLVSRTPREDMRLLPWVFLMHPYRIWMRLVQVASFLLEIFFWHSYTSPYLPEEVSKRVVKW